MFATDNNGVLIQLQLRFLMEVRPTVSGSLVFGIGTETNNGLGGAVIYPGPG